MHESARVITARYYIKRDTTPTIKAIMQAALIKQMTISVITSALDCLIVDIPWLVSDIAIASDDVHTFL